MPSLRAAATSSQLSPITQKGVKSGDTGKKPNLLSDDEKKKARDLARKNTVEALKTYHESKSPGKRRAAFARALKAQRESALLSDAYFEGKEEAPVQVQIGLREALISDKGVARSMLIREGPGNLGDRHWYTAEVLQKAVAEEVVEGAQCFLDHPTEVEDRVQPERSVLKLGGWYSDVAFGDYDDPKLGKVSAIFADLHPPVGNEKVIELLRTAVQYADKFPDKSYVGLSINAIGTGEKATINGEIWNRVDHLSEVVSVDLVTRAGAGGKLITFREAATMATRTRKKSSREGSTRSSETPKNGHPVGVRGLREAATLALVKHMRGKTAEEKRKLYESFAGFNRATQTKMLTEAAVDGSAIAKMLDDLSDSGIEQLTGVHPDEIDDMDDDDVKAALPGSDETDYVDGDLLSRTHEGTDGEDTESEESEEAEESEESEEAIADDNLPPDGATVVPTPGKPIPGKAALHKARKESSDQLKRIKDLESQLREAQSGRRAAEGKVHSRLLEQAAEKCFEQLNIPDGMRKRLRRQVMERAHAGYQGYKPIRTAKDIMDFVREEDLFVRASSRDGMGVVAANGTSHVAPPNWKKAGF